MDVEYVAASCDPEVLRPLATLLRSSWKSPIVSRPSGRFQRTDMTGIDRALGQPRRLCVRTRCNPRQCQHRLYLRGRSKVVDHVDAGCRSNLTGWRPGTRILRWILICRSHNRAQTRREARCQCAHAPPTASRRETTPPAGGRVKGVNCPGGGGPALLRPSVRRPCTRRDFHR